MSFPASTSAASAPKKPLPTSSKKPSTLQESKTTSESSTSTVSSQIQTVVPQQSKQTPSSRMNSTEAKEQSTKLPPIAMKATSNSTPISQTSTPPVVQTLSSATTKIHANDTNKGAASMDAASGNGKNQKRPLPNNPQQDTAKKPKMEPSKMPTISSISNQANIIPRLPNKDAVATMTTSDKVSSFPPAPIYNTLSQNAKTKTGALSVTKTTVPATNIQTKTNFKPGATMAKQTKKTNLNTPVPSNMINNAKIIRKDAAYKNQILMGNTTKLISNEGDIESATSGNHLNFANIGGGVPGNIADPSVVKAVHNIMSMLQTCKYA